MHLALELDVLASLIAAIFFFTARRNRQRQVNQEWLDRVMSGTARGIIAEMEHGPGAMEEE